MMKWTVQGGEGVRWGSDLTPVQGGDGLGAIAMAGSLLSGGEMRVGDGLAAAWTGSLAEVEGGGVFDRHPRTWGPAGWQALEAACARGVRPAGARLLIRPHARHVVSDVPGLRRFEATIAAAYPGRFGLLLDPASMLDVAHLEAGSAVDTLRRIAAEAAAWDTPELPLVGVVLANVRVVGERVMLTALDDGVLDAGLIRSLF